MKQSSFLVVCAVLVVGVVPASAQVSRPERPYRGLFRSTGAEAPAARELTLGVWVGGGYDDNLFAQTAFVGDEDTWVSGGFGEVLADLAYTQNTERVNFGASLATDNRYVPNFAGRNYVGSHSASIGVSTQVRRNGRLRLNQEVTYQPFLAFGFFPSLGVAAVGDADAPSPNFATPFDESFLYRTTADYTHQVSRRGSLGFEYEYQLTDFLDTDNDLGVQTAGTRYIHEVARGVGIRIGYQYSAGRYYAADLERTIRNHMLDLGVDYRRALSFSRQTMLSFGAGTGLVKELGGTQFLVVGDALLTHEMGRSWALALAYNRGINYVQTLSEPYLSNAVTARLGGLLGRRVELRFEAGSASGNVGFGETGDDGFVTHTAGSTVTVGLTRHLALIGQYAFYHHAFESGVALPEGLAPEADRHTVQASLSIWLPLYQRGTFNASR